MNKIDEILTELNSNKKVSRTVSDDLESVALTEIE